MSVYKKKAIQGTKIEAALDAICYGLEQKGMRYERENHYVPSYIMSEDDDGNPIKIPNPTSEHIGVGYAVVRYYYDNRRFATIYLCNHLIDCNTCKYHSYATIYNYTDDVFDTHLPGDIPVDAYHILPEDTSPDKLNDNCLYYTTTSFIPICSSNITCPTCGGTGGTTCKICNGNGTVQRSIKVKGVEKTINTVCNECAGVGYVVEYTDCAFCEGRGYNEVFEKYETPEGKLTFRYVNTPCPKCNATGKRPSYCLSCDGNGEYNNSLYYEYNAYTFYLNQKRDEDGNLIPLNGNISNIIPILPNKKRISKFDPPDTIYVAYNPNKIIDLTHLPDKLPDVSDNDDITYEQENIKNHLEFYKIDYTENKSSECIATNVAIDINDIDSLPITNYTQHCIAKTFDNLTDIEAILNFIFYKDKNKTIYPLNDNISYLYNKFWDIDYNLEYPNYNVNLSLSALDKLNLACDYTSFDVGKSSTDSETDDSNIYSADFISCSIATDITTNSYDVADYTRCGQTTTESVMPKWQRKFYPLEHYDNINGNIEIDQQICQFTYGTGPGAYTKTYKSDHSSIMLDTDKEYYLCGELTVTDFKPYNYDVSGTESWLAYRNELRAKHNDPTIEIENIKVEVNAYTNGLIMEAQTPSDFDLLNNSVNLCTIELPYDTVNVYDTTMDNADNELVDTETLIDTYKIWNTEFTVPITNSTTITNIISNKSDIVLGLTYIIYIKSEDTESNINNNHYTEYTYCPDNIIHKSNLNIILANNVNINTEIDNYIKLRYNFRLPYVEYDHANTKESQNNLNKEGCFIYYSKDYSDYIKAFKWYTFDTETGKLLPNKPDTFEMHLEDKKTYANFITQHELKSIYSKTTFDPKEYDTTYDVACRIQCPTCNGSLVDSYSARCRTCAGSGVIQRYFYYKCNEFKNATKYINGHAPEVNLNTDIPTINDAPDQYITDDEREKLDVTNTYMPYVEYAALNYYNTLPGTTPEEQEKYNRVKELVQYNTVLYQYNGNMNKLYWWDGIKHIQVNLGFKYIYRTITVSKADLIYESVDESGNKTIIAGDNAYEPNTFKVICNDNTVLYRVMGTLDEFDDLVGFYGYNLDKKAYERIYFDNAIAFERIKTESENFNLFDVSASLVSLDTHAPEEDSVQYDDENIVLDDLNAKYLYKYKTNTKISFDNLMFEVDQHFIDPEE